MITSIKQFRLLSVQKGITLSYHASVSVTDMAIQFPTVTTQTYDRPVHSPGVSGAWFWSDTSKPCPLVVEQLADDHRAANTEVWRCMR